MQQIYGKPIYDLLEECAYQLDEKLGSFRERDIREWFEKNYPKIKKTTLSAQIRLCTANSYSRLEAWPDTNFRNKKGDVFWKISRGVYVKYVSEKHGQPDYLK